MAAPVPLKVDLDRQSFTAAYNTLAAAINANQAAITVTPISAQAGTAYTLAIGDAGNSIIASNAAAVTITVPANNAVTFPIGSIVRIWSTGAGGVTVVPAGGVTITGTLTVATGAMRELLKTGVNTWVMA